LQLGLLKLLCIVHPRRSGDSAIPSANFCYNKEVPQKIRELIRELEAAGFVNRGGKGDHRNSMHPKLDRPITISGNSGDDAKPYQERAVIIAIEESL
jgi:predicted RNA binding protein YcfA (HicA-like mRNA interferase family)